MSFSGLVAAAVVVVVVVPIAKDCAVPNVAGNADINNAYL